MLSVLKIEQVEQVGALVVHTPFSTPEQMPSLTDAPGNSFPARTRYVYLRPGMCCPFPRFGTRCMLIAADKAGGQADLASGLDKQGCHIAA